MPKKTDSGNARDWLRYVEEDLTAVELLVRHQTSFMVCKSKLAEALEKGLKADLISRGWVLKKVHDLQKLCDYLASYESARADRLQPTVDDLAESYIEGRYPGFDLEEPDWPRAEMLLAQVKNYAEKLTHEIASQAQSCAEEADGKD